MGLLNGLPWLSTTLRLLPELRLLVDVMMCVLGCGVGCAVVTMWVLTGAGGWVDAIMWVLAGGTGCLVAASAVPAETIAIAPPATIPSPRPKRYLRKRALLGSSLISGLRHVRSWRAARAADARRGGAPRTDG